MSAIGARLPVNTGRPWARWMMPGMRSSAAGSAPPSCQAARSRIVRSPSPTTARSMAGTFSIMSSPAMVAWGPPMTTVLPGWACLTAAAREKISKRFSVVTDMPTRSASTEPTSRTMSRSFMPSTSAAVTCTGRPLASSTEPMERIPSGGMVLCSFQRWAM